MSLDISWKVVADLYAILIWSTNDNGYALMRTVEQWLNEKNDERKIKIALNLDVYPFKEKKTMKKTLKEISMIFPELSEMCGRLIESRERISA